MFDRHHFFIQLQTGFDLAVMQEQSLTLTLEEFVCQGLAFRMTPNAITVSSERCDCPMLTDRLFVSASCAALMCSVTRRMLLLSRPHCNYFACLTDSLH